MHDYKPDRPDTALHDAVNMFAALAALLTAFRFDPERAREEVNAEYSTTTELAADQAWVRTTREGLAEAAHQLDTAFAALQDHDGAGEMKTT